MSTDQTRVLVLVSEMKKALAKATTLEDLTRVRNEAEAVRCLVQKAKLGLKMHNEAAEFKLRAERKAGEMLSALNLYGGDRKSSSHDANLKLKDLGIGKDQSSRWQKEAAISERDFEAFLQDIAKANKELTAAELLRRSSSRSAPRRRRPRTIDARREGNGYIVEEPLPANASGAKADRVVPEGDLLKELLTEAKNHRALLASILLPFCETGRPIKPAARQHAGRLLQDLGSVIDQAILISR